MKVLVLGGYGNMGRSAVWDLAESPDVSQVIVGDINIEKGRRLINAIGSKKLAAECVDVEEHVALVKLMKSVDVVANATYANLREKVSKAALEAKVGVVDLGGSYDSTVKLLGLSESAKQAGITIISGMGYAPGLTNLFAKYGANKLDQVEEIHLRYAIVATSPVGRPGLKSPVRIYGHFGLLTVKPIILRDGKLIEVEPRSGREIFRFPKPVGDFPVHYTMHSEMATLPRSIKGVRNMDMKMGYPPEIESRLEWLIDLGFDSTQPLEVEGMKIEPRKLIASCLEALSKDVEISKDCVATVVEVIGEKDREKTEWTFETVVEPFTEWNVSATSYNTGVPTSIATQMLGRGDITLKGVYGPEECIDPEAFIRELSKRNIRVWASVKKMI